MLSWDPLPGSADVVFYRVYESKGTGAWWHLAVVDASTVGSLVPGKIALVDAPDYWPWPTGGPTRRCYTVAAVSKWGLEGPMSAQACSSPP